MRYDTHDLSYLDSSVPTVGGLARHQVYRDLGVGVAGELHACELQLVPLQNTGGKLETCIRREAPVVLAALVEEGILKP